jgi:hypothetical protein
MRIRLFVSGVLVVLYGIFQSLYTPYARYIVEAQLAPLQVGGDCIQYGLSRNLTIADFISAFMLLLLVSSLIFMWLAYYLSHSELKMEPSKLDRFFMRVLSLTDLALSPTSKRIETAVSTPTPNS